TIRIRERESDIDGVDVGHEPARSTRNARNPVWISVADCEEPRRLLRRVHAPLERAHRSSWMKHRYRRRRANLRDEIEEVIRGAVAAKPELARDVHLPQRVADENRQCLRR